MKRMARFIPFVASRISSTTGGKRSRTAITVAIAGITLALFTIIVTLSIVTGFQQELKTKISAFNSTFTIYREDWSDIDTNEFNTISTIVEGLFPEARVYRSESIPALVKSEDNFDNILLIFNDEPSEENFFADYVTEGSLPTDSSIFSVLISETTSRKLSLSTGDRMDVVVTAGNGYRQRRFNVSGIYDTHFTDFDGAVAFVNRYTVKSLGKAGADVAHKINIDLPGVDFDRLPDISEQLYSSLNSAVFNGELNGRYYITDIAQQAGGYLGWLALLDTNVVVITLLMVFIAAFTLICSIVIIILERIPLIGILKAMGASGGDIKKIFLIFGSKIILTSIVLADVLAFLLIFLQNESGVLQLNPEDYYLSQVPMALDVWSFITVDISAALLGFLFMLLPTFTVSRISLTKAIRFE